MTDVTTTTDAALANVESFADAVAYATATGTGVHKIADVLGDSFQLIGDKSKLVGVSMILLKWNYVKGDNGTYASVRALANFDDGPRRIVFNDGGKGLKGQLSVLEGKDIRTGVLVEQGLRRSDFYYDARSAANGGTGGALSDDEAADVRADHGPDAVRRATAYYLDVSA